MHAAAANDPPLLARNLLGGPLRPPSATVTGNTCMPGAVVEMGLGAPTQRDAHETPRRSLLLSCPSLQIAVDSYFIIMSNGRGPSKRHFIPPLLLLRPLSVSDLPDEGHFSCDDDDDNTKDRTVILFCSVCRHRSTRGMNRLLQGLIPMCGCRPSASCPWVLRAPPRRPPQDLLSEICARDIRARDRLFLSFRSADRVGIATPTKTAICTFLYISAPSPPPSPLPS